MPDEWLGIHARRRDEAREKAAGLPQTLANFAIAMALLDDWDDLPGIGGNPAAWDFDAIPWALIGWVSEQVFTDLRESLRVPKNSSAPLPAGATASTEKA